MRRYITRAVPVRATARIIERSPRVAIAAALLCAAMALPGVAVQTPAAYAQVTAPAESGSAEAAAPARVTSVTSIRPAKRKVIRKRFAPAATAGPRKVRRIIGLEARRWNISPSSLSRRVGCESTYKWDAGNGAYQGLLQFATSTFYRGMSSIRTRKVRFVRKRKRMVRATRLVYYSDGSVKRKPGIKRWQKLVTVYRGTLPRNPPVTHVWAQLRIGSQAIRGLSAVSSSEWSCSA